MTAVALTGEGGEALSTGAFSSVPGLSSFASLCGGWLRTSTLEFEEETVFVAT